MAGPRTLEHLVDVVLHFEGDRHSRLRMVRAVKNRYGPTDEVGCFDLGEYGLIGLADPSGLFLSRHREPVPGTCVTVTLEGRRPLLAEVQALVGHSVLEVPRRVTSGLDASRIGMVLAVLQRRADVKVGKSDVYAATVGGVRLTEPSVDLAVALAIASSVANLSLPQASSWSARSAWPARCATSPACPAGWPRRSGWVSARRSSPRARPAARARFGDGGHRGRRRARCPEGRLPRLSPELESVDEDWAGLAVPHRHRVERARGPGRQRARAARRARWPAVPGHRQHLRHAEREPDRLGAGGLQAAESHTTWPAPGHDHLDRAGP